VTGTRGVCFVDYILQTCELFGGNLLEQSLPESAGYERLLEMYKTTDRIQFGVTKEEPLKAELDQFHDLLRTGEAGELCLGDDASRAVLLAERAVNVVRTRDSHETDAWI
jgi:UDP-N-acetylglucosamine 3-dehydrogenase